MVLDDENLWDIISVSTMFAFRATVHNTMQYTPAQLVFRRDSILNTRHKANWYFIKKRKQDLMDKGNQRKNCNKKEQTYNKRDKDVLKNVRKSKFNQDMYLGPYIITAVRNNGTVRARKGKIRDTFNIYNITLYKE